MIEENRCRSRMTRQFARLRSHLDSKFHSKKQRFCWRSRFDYRRILGSVQCCFHDESEVLLENSYSLRVLGQDLCCARYARWVRSTAENRDIAWLGTRSVRRPVSNWPREPRSLWKRRRAGIVDRTSMQASSYRRLKCECEHDGTRPLSNSLASYFSLKQQQVKLSTFPCPTPISC